MSYYFICVFVNNIITILFELVHAQYPNAVVTAAMLTAPNAADLTPPGKVKVYS